MFNGTDLLPVQKRPRISVAIACSKFFHLYDNLPLAVDERKVSVAAKLHAFNVVTQIFYVVIKTNTNA